MIKGIPSRLYGLTSPGLGIELAGAEGVPERLKDKFDEVISFGKMVWPHLFVRIMLMEQVYRASTIIAGLPYHKD